jgi:nitronate monooxygenase
MAFCICNGLLASAGINETEKELWTVGANAYKVNQIMSVQDLMNELTQVKELAPV